jgi:undecaprenyl diphosphate synthase
MGLKTNINNKAKEMVLQTSGFNLPKSLLIIPDGNGRWAKQMGVSISQGHKMGGKTMSKILDDFMQVGIDVLGVWGFSEDNWKRPSVEIEKIMEVIEEVIKNNLEKLIENNIKFMVLGKRERIKDEYNSLFNTIEDAENKTSKNNGKTLALFVDYGEKYQLEELAKARKEDKYSTTYKLLSNINKGLPLFDMVLRTSGEQRLSGFGPLASLAEFVSVKKNLPELTDKDMIEALRKFSGRLRRFGGR